MSPIEALYLALQSRLGIVLAVSDVARAKAALYAARKKSGDPDLDVLEVRTSRYRPEEELWLTKKGSPDGTKE